MKKIAALLLTAVMMLTFSSCASTELELKNRIIVEAIGIDYCDIGVRVTVQFLNADQSSNCLLYTSPSPRDRQKSRMPSSA